VARAVDWARAAGLAVSLDLIYGTPGESLADWRTSVDAALALEPDHISAYALVIEPGTRMGGQLRRGLIAPTDPDVQAAMYELADEAFAAAGLSWYEVSNWARTPQQRCRHNLAYWRSDDWWGIGPGAHSYLGPRDAETGPLPARRWWNVKHPLAYSRRLAEGLSPEDDGEDLTADAVAFERVMLGLRLAEGLEREAVGADKADAIAQLIADGVLDGASALRGRLVLTRRGRLLADAAIRALA